jgi:hypothetical protein
MSKINAAEFKQRLEALLLSPGGRGLPRKRRDWDILFKSITLALEAGRDYSEKEVNQVVEEWLDGIGQAIDIDYVTLRRHLVDAGYLVRDLAGTSYRVGLETMAELFEPAADKVDPTAVVEEARSRKEQRKRQYLESRDKSST